MSGKSKSAKSQVAKAIGPAEIVATSQQSRFHVDTLDTLSKEIDLKTVNISIGKKDILVDAHIRLKSNVCYGMVGRNGQGKSTVLKALAEKIIPGVPENLRILLVGQVEEISAVPVGGSLKPTDNPTVVQHVVESDSNRQGLLWELQTLSSSVESGSHIRANLALAVVLHSRSLKELELAQKVASKRSGARGADARKALLVAESNVEEADKRLEEAQKPPELDPATISDVHQKIQSIVEEVQSALELMNSDATEARARAILLGLGFDPEQLDAKYSSLSGGWRSRCTLASALLQRPNLLILDEPTNYLDIPSVIWLQGYLQELDDTTILIVAHDRAFLDAVTTETIVLRGQQLSYFEGSISQYEHAAMKKRKNDIKIKAALDRQKAVLEKSISDGVRAAKKAGDDKKIQAFKSKQKKLDERWGLERNDKGHKFKLHRDFGGYALTSRKDVEIDDLDPPVNIPLPDPEPMRFPGSLCSASNVSFRYSPRTHWVLEDATIPIQPGGRVGLVGKNGEGKSTLVKLLIGELKPTKGTVERHPRLRMGYYSQHSVEEFNDPAIASTPPLLHFMQQLKQLHNIEIDEGTARSFLGAFGLQGVTAVNPIGTLSGGQKVRLALALIVYPAPDLLVLDEVSTHLDMDTTAGLMKKLRTFQGAILLVSHDRHLIQCVIEGAPLIPPSELADDESDASEEDEEEEDAVKGTVFRVGPKGKVRELPGGVNDYVAIVERKMARGKK